MRLIALFAALAISASAFAQEKFSVLGEFTPGASLQMSFEEKAQFTRGVMRELPLADLAGLFGLQAFDWSYRSGGYQQTIAPNVVVSVSTEQRARVRAFALAWMYVYQQDAVPFFSAGDGGRPAMRLRFEKRLTPATEARMYASLVQALGDKAGYTRTGDGEIVVLDLDGSPGFYPALAAFASSNRVVSVEHFTARTECLTHDWRRDPLGEALLRNAGVTPQVEAKLRSLRARFQRFVADWQPQLVITAL